jgi:hypothetical protein
LKEDTAQLIVPLPAGDDLADRLVGLLGGLFPPEVTGPGSGSPPTITGS